MARGGDDTQGPAVITLAAGVRVWIATGHEYAQGYAGAGAAGSGAAQTRSACARAGGLIKTDVTP